MTFIASNILPAKDSTFVTGTPSAWAADVNVSGSPTLSSSYWYPDGGAAPSLQVTAATTATVSIVYPRTAIAAGTTYAFRAPIRTSDAQAGAQTTLTVTWYNAPTGGSTVGTAATLSKPLTNTASSGGSTWSSSNYFTLFAVAPAGATHAALSIAAGAITAAKSFYLDNLYFGEYDNTGNLLAPADATFETDTAGWSSTTSTLARSDQHASNGFHSLLSTSAGSATTITSGSYFAATPGAHYAGTLKLFNPSPTVSVSTGIRWYDSAHVMLSDSVSTQSVPSDGSGFFQHVITGTAPTSSAYGKIVLTYTAASGDTLYIDSVYLSPYTLDAGNLLTYTQSTFEDALPAWTVQHGTMSRTALQWIDWLSAWAGRLVSDGSGTLMTASQNALVAVTAGQVYRFSGMVGRHLTASESVPMSARMRIDWYNASSVLLAVGGAVPFQTLTSSATLDWWPVGVEDVAPAGAAYAKINVEIDPTSSILIDEWYLDQLSLAADDPDEQVEVDSENGLIRLQVAWPDDADHPHTGTLRIRRMEPDGSAHPVRTIWGESTALQFADTGTPVLVEDYEAPLGLTVWYLMEWFDSGGTLTHTLSTEYVQGPVTDGDHVWMKSPGLPALNTMLVPESPLSWSRSARAAAYQVVGRTNPIVISDVRNGRSASATFLVFDTADHIQLDALMDSGLPVLFQAMPGLGADGSHYFSVGDVAIEPLSSSAAEPGWRWTVALTEVDRPSGGLQGSADRTWQDLLDQDPAGTWLGLFNSNPTGTWADLLTS